MSIIKNSLLPLIIGIIIGIFIPSSHLSDTVTEIRQSGKYQFINPLLECDNSNFSNLDQNLSHLKQSTIELIKTLQSQKNLDFAAVYFRDLNNGPWFGINEKEDFSPASLIKVHMMMAYYKLAESQPGILNQVIINTEADENSRQNISPSTTLTPNQPYTINQLIHNMIIKSDNSAHELLYNNIDALSLNQVYRDLNIDFDKANTDPTGNIISVKNYASAFRILYNASYLSHSMSEKALKLLSQTEYKQALAAGLPQAVTVAHKFGERQYPNGEKQLHDCGIVYLPQKPYLLCVMTKGQDFDRLSHSIKSISQSIYQSISSL